MGWTKVGNVRGPEGPIVPLDSLTDVNVSSAATGALLMKMPDGTWQGRPNTVSNLNSLTDVTAPTDTAAGKVLGTTAVGAWGPVDVTLDSISDVTITLPAQGEVLTRSPTGWRNLPLPAAPAAPTPSLDSLTDVTAAPSTPAGKVLGTTAVGAWGPVDPPATGWGKWVGTQAQYDAITTKDPGVLYVVTD
jgi:hypothetical protein